MSELKAKQDMLSAKEAMLSLDADIEEAKARERVFEESAMAENAPTADQPLVTSHQTTASAVSEQSSVVSSVPISSMSSSIPNRQQLTKIIVASGEDSVAPFIPTRQGTTLASVPSGRASFIPQSSVAAFIPTGQGIKLSSVPSGQSLTSSSVTGHVCFVPQSLTAPFIPTGQGTTLASVPSGQGLTSSSVAGHVSFVPQSSTAPFTPTGQGMTLASVPSGQGSTSLSVAGHVSFVPQSSTAPFIPAGQGMTLAYVISGQGLTSSSVAGHVSFVPQSSTAPFIPTGQGTTLASAPSGQGLVSSSIAGHASFIPQSSTAPFIPTAQGMTLASVLPGQGLTSSSVAGHVSSVPGQQPTATSHDLLLRTHQQLAAAMVLPHAEVPTFKGDILEFVPFMMAFETRIVPHTSRDSDRLYYLMQHLEGQPKRLIDGCLYMEPTQGYSKAMEQLHKVYGDPYVISTAYINELKNWSHIKDDDHRALQDFALFLIKCNHAMQAMSHMLVLNHAPNLQLVISKLPWYLQDKWMDFSLDNIQHQETVDFTMLVKFVEKTADARNHPIFGRDAIDRVDQPTLWSNAYKQKSSFVTLFTPDRDESATGDQCHLCKEMHHLDECPRFKQKSMEERKEYIKENSLCFGCFGSDHMSRACLKKRCCRVCGKCHPSSMHIENFMLMRNNADNCNYGIPDTKPPTVSAKTCITGAVGTVLQCVLPVQVRINGSNEIVNTYALYDTGSTGCFITESIRNQLKPSYTETTVKLRTMHGTDVQPTKIVSGLVVSDYEGNNAVELPETFTRMEIPVDRDEIPKKETLQQWPHLQEIADKVPVYYPDLEVGLLIGSNCPSALQPLQIIPTTGSDPFAVKYKHGWTVNRPVRVKSNLCNITCHRTMMSDVGHSTDNTTDSVTNFSDYDNGQALDKKKRTSYLDACNNELEENQKEGDMCMEEQMIMHSYSDHNKTPAADKQSHVFSNEEKILSNQDIKIDSNEITRDLWKSDGDSNKETCFNDLLVSRESEISSDIHRLLRSADS